MTRGVVKFFNAQKGYGFITREHQVFSCIFLIFKDRA
jgi:cold shock CspA family protein